MFLRCALYLDFQMFPPHLEGLGCDERRRREQRQSGDNPHLRWFWFDQIFFVGTYKYFYRGGGRDLRRGRRQLRLAKHPPEQRLVVVRVGVDGRGGVGRPRLRAVQLVESVM